MAKQRSRGPKPHKFRNKLLLNQWLISLFGIDPLVEHKVNGKAVRPFHRLAAPIRGLIGVRSCIPTFLFSGSLLPG